ncbi:MAG TPA: SDR family oxidoreductase [Pseudonocardiaceae bacterium]
MRVFVTGATGHIGSLVVAELHRAGHKVLGLARSETSAAALTATGATAHRGDLADVDGLREAAAAADGVIHLAFGHDFSDYAGAGAADQRAVAAIGEALAGSGKPFVVTSGTAGLALGLLGRESDELVENGPMAPRVPTEHLTVALAERDVRTSIIRLAPSVHGPGDTHGFIPQLIDIARTKGVSAYIGDGRNRWPAVHDLDAARLYRLALEAAPAGSRWHGVGDEGVSTREIAEAIGRAGNLPVASVSEQDAAAHFGWLAALLGMDIPASNQATRDQLGWRPAHPGLIEDIETGHYLKD